MNDDQKANLEKLATYLESLPADYSHFAMDDFFCQDTGTSNDFKEYKRLEGEYARNNGGVGRCGAVACAVGHGPAAGILFHSSELFPSGNPDWGSYADRFCELSEFPFLFGGDWTAFDNTHQGAAKRIRYLLAGNEIPLPEDYTHQAMMEMYNA